MEESLIELDIEGFRGLRLAHLVLDVNGTLALDGDLLPGVSERVGVLRDAVDVQLLSSDTYGRLEDVAATLEIAATRLEPGKDEAEQKADFVRALGAGEVVAVGNGVNDAAMLETASLGIAVVGPEGLAASALESADVVTVGIQDALDLLIHPQRLLATLRR